MQEFWLFSFERYNGILGKQPTNNRDIESQLMERFLRENAVQSSSYPEDFREDLLSITESVSVNKVVGSVLDTVSYVDPGFVAPTRCSRGVLTTNEIDTLKKLVLKITGIPYSFTINGKYYRSSANPSKHPAVALASWDENLCGSATQIPCSSLLPPTSILRPVHVFYFMKVIFTHGQTNHSILFSHVSWFSPHPDCHALGKPVELWCASLFGLASYLPITNITCRCAHAFRNWHNEKVLLSVPLIE